MFKELIISIIIVICIIFSDFKTQYYTKQSIEEASTMLGNLREEINTNEDKLEESINKIYETWDERVNKLSYFIEHNELEKVETSLTRIKSYIQVGDLNMAIASIDETNFILNHIKEKNSLNLQNIF